MMNAAMQACLQLTDDLRRDAVEPEYCCCEGDTIVTAALPIVEFEKSSSFKYDLPCS